MIPSFANKYVDTWAIHFTSLGFSGSSVMQYRCFLTFVCLAWLQVEEGQSEWDLPPVLKEIWVNGSDQIVSNVLSYSKSQGNITAETQIRREVRTHLAKSFLFMSLSPNMLCNGLMSSWAPPQK